MTSEVIDAQDCGMSSDAGMTDDDAAIVARMHIAREWRAVLRAGAAELHRRGWTYLRIANELGVAESTAHRWAQPKLHEDG